MKKYIQSRSSIFLLELILNLLLFTVLVVVGLNFFVKTHTLTIKTSDLHRAVTQTNNIAALYETSYGGLDIIANKYPYSIITNDSAIIYFDDKFKECSSSESKYMLTIDIDNSSILHEADITFSKASDKIYEVTVCNYKQLTPSSMEVQ